MYFAWESLITLSVEFLRANKISDFIQPTKEFL